MQKSNIDPSIYQEMLACAPNAGAKGQSQWFTPIEFARTAAIPLPDLRPNITDLTCGAGDLLHGTANATTTALYGVEIQPHSGAQGMGHGAKSKEQGARGAEHGAMPHAPRALPIHRITGDVTLVYPLLRVVDWRGDIFSLNMPFDLHFWRDRIADLAQSRVPAVVQAFTAHDGRTRAETIDSTITGILMSLDRMTGRGEGFAITNAATIERLILSPGAPHSALARHCWAWVTLPGNPMTGLGQSAWSREQGAQSAVEPGPLPSAPCATPPYRTGLLYFARDHQGGLKHRQDLERAEDLEAALKAVKARRRALREGAELRTAWDDGGSGHMLWQAVSAEWKARQATARSDFNLWLRADGTIGTALSLFDQHGNHAMKAQASRLHRLAGKRPMQLVMTRNEREELLHLCGVEQRARGTEHGAEGKEQGAQGAGTPCPMPQAPCAFRVDPKLRDAVLLAVTDYHACRAPLYPLPPIQRLGYLEEEDFILCRADLLPPQGAMSTGQGAKSKEQGARSAGTPCPMLHAPCAKPLFKAGQRYPLRTESIMVIRRGHKPNLSGELDAIEYSGQELAMFVTDETGEERLFLEARLRTEDVRLSFKNKSERKAMEVADFTLQDLAAHFHIPEVPDISQVHPLAYAENLRQLEALEAVLG